jgi:hypothetical protein
LEAVEGMTELQRILADLQRVLAIDIVSGQVTLNFHQQQLQSVETKTYTKITANEYPRAIRVLVDVAKK